MADKAWYWVALGVLALGLNQGFPNGRMDLPRRIADRSAALAEELSGRAIRTLALMQAATGRPGSEFETVQPALARVQANLACAQATLARKQAEMTMRKVDVVRRQRDQIRALVVDKMCVRKQILTGLPNAAPVPHDGTI